MKKKQFIKALKSYKGTNVFNPYTDVCEHFDRYNANKLRTSNLSSILESALQTGVDSLWIGRDLGHRGGRRTGLALTDEANFAKAELKWNVKLVRATKGEQIAERTAANIWQKIEQIDKTIFMWNVFPFHPHEKHNGLSNRSHTAKERDAGKDFLKLLVELLNPSRIIAIGNDAHKSASSLFSDNRVSKVRHPSYGGEKDFSKQLASLYGLSKRLN